MLKKLLWVIAASAVPLAAYVKEQLEVWGKAIRDAGIQPD